MTRLTEPFRLFNRLTRRCQPRFALRRLSVMLILMGLLAPIAMPIRSSASSVIAQSTQTSALASTVDSVVAALSTFFSKMKRSGEKSRVMPIMRPASRPQETPSVANLELTPEKDFELSLDEQIMMMAVPLDDTGSPVQGITAEWESSDERVVSITSDGEATANSSGTATLTASAGGQSASVEVTVGEARSAPSPSDEGTLPDDETDSLYTPANIVGAPPGKSVPAALTPAAATGGSEMPGSSNFSFGVPLLSLPGRRIDVSLGLVYNSRLWNNSTESNGRTRLTYDVDAGWPAPGFRLGYGQLESQGTDALTLTDPDGTRHEMRQINGSYIYESTDGTFTRYSSVTKTVTYTDGTHVVYDVGGTGTRFYPTRITDRHGNYLAISYVTRFQPQIKTIQDTLARFVRFYYNTNNELTSITVPRYQNQQINGNRERTVVRFYYMITPITGAFSTSVDVTSPASTPRGIQYLYFPGTQSGYRYDYSTYGMMYKTTQLRGMTASNTAVTQEGQTAATTTYDYHGSPGGQTVPSGGLTDAPFYKHRTDEWAGRTTGGAAPSYTFDVSTDHTTTTITAPDQTVTETKTISAPGEWNDGLIESTTTKYGNNILAKTATSWEHDNHNDRPRNPRPTRIEVTNDAGQTRAILYTAYDEFNNVKEFRELDFSAPGTNGNELRRTVMTYRHEQETDENSPYHRLRLLHLPTSVEVYSASGTTATLMSKVDYSYDTVAITSSPNYLVYSDIKMLDARYNPNFPSVFDSTIKRGDLVTTTSYTNVNDLNNADKKIVTWQHYDVAGNVFAAKLTCCQQKTFNYVVDNQYAYVMSETDGSNSSTQLVTSATYDRYTGVALTGTDENGQTTTIDYEAATLRLSKITRPDGGYTQTIYDDTLHAEPDQTHMHSLITTNTGPADSDGGDVTSYQYFDGRGAVTRTFVDDTAEGYATTDIRYDKLGRVEWISNPYLTPYSSRSTQAINPTAKWMKRVYDHLGRVTSITLPDGNLAANENVIQIAYAGITTTVTDAAGKSRRQITDALGRVVRVDEPGSTNDPGSVNAPTQPTQYWYDALDNVVKITQGGTWQGESVQGGQTRYFMYDSLSRLIRERQIEEDTPAQNNLTDPLTGNSAWSCRYEYNDNDHGLLTDSYNARQIHTQYTYDTTFHRLTGMTYSGGATDPHEVLVDTPDVTYTYGNDAASFNKGRLIKVETAALGTSVLQTAQEYGYDLMGRVTQQTETVGSNSYKLAYSYNKLGQLRTQTYPSGRVVSYDYNDGAHLSGVRDTYHTYLSDLTYGANGGLMSETIGNESNNAVRTFSYNLNQQLSQISVVKGNSVLQRYDYKYGVIDESTGEVDEMQNTGQIARIEGFIGGTASNPTKQWQQRMSYDSLGRLSKVAEYQGTTSTLSYKASYTYDAYGNRYQYASQNSTAGQADPQPYVHVEDSEISKTTNRFISTGATPVSYDAAGNLVEDRKFRQMQYRYDANGRQRWAKQINDNSEVTSLYDGVGQRVATQVNTEGWQYLVYDIFGQLVAEYGGASSAESGVRFMMGDNQGSTRALIDSSGAVLARHDYLAFGEEVQAGTGMRTSGQGYGAMDQIRQRYDGMERDASSSGLDHTLWRKYDSSAGRWTSPDPYTGSMSLGDPQSFNRYAYVENDPVNFVDPSGLQFITTCSTVVGADGGGTTCVTRWVEDPEEVNFGHGEGDVGGGLPHVGGQGRGRRGTRQKTSRRQNSSVCDKMADDAQNQANKAIKAANGDLTKALKQFDNTFTSMYLAHPMATYRDAIDLARRQDVFGTSHNRGSTGFREQFLDSEGGHVSRGNNVDQTHHFAAYFSGGINGQWTATFLHDNQDYYWHDNEGDYRLGVAAYDLGAKLSGDPSQLKGIGDLIRSTICNP